MSVCVCANRLFPGGNKFNFPALNKPCLHMSFPKVPLEFTTGGRISFFCFCLEPIFPGVLQFSYFRHS